MRRLNLLFFAVFLLSLTFVSPTESWKYNYLDQGEEVQVGGNYSINVNDTEHLEGRNTATLYTYFKSLLDLLYIPYTGATQDVDLGNNNLKVNGKVEFGEGSGSNAKIELSGGDFIIDGEQDNSETNGMFIRLGDRTFLNMGTGTNAGDYDSMDVGAYTGETWGVGDWTFQDGADFNNNKLTNLANGTADTDAVNLAQLNSLPTGFDTYTTSTTAFSSTAYVRVAKVPINATNKNLHAVVKAETGSGTITSMNLDISIAHTGGTGSQIDSSITAHTSHTYNSDSSAENGYVVRYARISHDTEYWYLDFQKYNPNTMTIEITPTQENEWEFFEGDISTSVSELSDSKTAHLGHGLRGTSIVAGSASSASYSSYGIYGGFTNSDSTNKTDLWQYVGYQRLQYSSTYDNGLAFNFKLMLNEFGNNGQDSEDMDNLILNVKGTLEPVTTSTEFNTAVPEFTLTVEGDTDLTEEDFAIFVYSTATNYKYIRIYIKHQNPNTTYDLIQLNRYGQAYSSTNTDSISYTYFYRVADGGYTATLPTPAQGTLQNAIFANKKVGNLTSTNLITGKSVGLNSTVTDRRGTWDYDGSWADYLTYIVWDDSDGNEEGAIEDNFVPTTGHLYKVSFDYDITIGSTWDTDVYSNFGGTNINIPDSGSSSSGSNVQYIYATSASSFVIYIEDYSEGANVYEFSNIKIEEVTSDGLKFDGFLGTEYNNGKITSDKLVLDINELIYSGTYSNNIIPSTANDKNIGSSTYPWNRAFLNNVYTGTLISKTGNNEWLYFGSGNIGMRVGGINGFYFYPNDYRVLDNHKAIFGSGQDSSIYYTGTNLNINPKAVGSGVVYVEGEVTADGYNEYTFTTNATDEEAYNLVKYATTNFFVNETKNYTVWGECYNEIPITDMDRPEVETYVEENCYEQPCINETKIRTIYPYTKPQPTVSLSCKQAMISKADNWEREHMKIVNSTTYGHIIDFDDGIMTENIWTQSKTIEDGVSYIDKIKDKEKLKVKQDHHAYELIDDYELLNMEDRVVALEGAVNEIFTILCDKNILKKEDGCLK